MTTEELINTLKGKDVTNLYHANSVATSLTFINNNGLYSRQAVEDLGLKQTAQSSDENDKKVGVYNDIFFDSDDIHSRAKQQNFYGPVTFVYDVDVLEGFDIDCIKITKTNPEDWKEEMSEEERYIQNISREFIKGDFKQEITIRNQSAPLSFEKLKCVILDDPKIKNKKHFENAYYALSDAMKKAGIKVPLKIRECEDDCKCKNFYCSNSSYIFRKFKTSV